VMTISDCMKMFLNHLRGSISQGSDTFIKPTEVIKSSPDNDEGYGVSLTPLFRSSRIRALSVVLYLQIGIVERASEKMFSANNDTWLFDIYCLKRLISGLMDSINSMSNSDNDDDEGSWKIEQQVVDSYAMIKLKMYVYIE
jgi:hypothetical protein